MATETKNLKKLTKNLGLYLGQDQLEQVKKAYFFAANAHSGQFRVSGDPYVSHPLAVAEILGKLKMDEDCLSAAMLPSSGSGFAFLISILLAATIAFRLVVCSCTRLDKQQSLHEIVELFTLIICPR